MGLDIRYKNQRLLDSFSLPVKPISLTEWNAMTDDQRNREVLWLVDQSESRSWDVRESSSRYVLYYHNEMVGGDEVQIVESVNESNPIGTIISFMGTSAPSGYLVCDGTEYQISQYNKLADFFQEQFGSSSYFGGDGIDTFAVPDLQNMFLRGNTLNRDVGNVQEGTKFPNHSFDFAVGRSNFCSFPVPNIVTVPQHFDDMSSEMGPIAYINLPSQNAANVQSSYFTARPDNVAVLFCIKATDSGNDISNEAIDWYSVYSEEEVLIGEWFGKPLYRRVLSCTVPNDIGENVTIADVTEFGIDFAVRVEGVIIGTIAEHEDYTSAIPISNNLASWSSGIFLSYADDARAIRFYGSKDTNNTGAPLYVTIEYTKVDDDTKLSDFRPVTESKVSEMIAAASFGGYTNNAYSFEETRIGTWIDGKPLYRQVIVTNLPESEDNIPISIPIDSCATCRAILIDPVEGFQIPNGFYNTRNSYFSIYYASPELGVHVAFNQYYGGAVVKIILEYTKTTDEP